MKDICAQFAAPPVVAGSSWEGHCDPPLERRWLPKISVRAGHVLFDGLKAKTFGDLFALDAEKVLATKNSGVKTVKEIIALRDAVLAEGPDKILALRAAEEASKTTNLPRSASSASRSRCRIRISGRDRRRTGRCSGRRRASWPRR